MTESKSDAQPPAKRTPPPQLRGRQKQPARTELGRVHFAQDQKKSMSKPARYHFWLECLGPNGYYNGGDSEPFEYMTNFTTAYPPPQSGDASAVFNAFVRMLWDDGWTPAGFPGPRSSWYQIAMRRVVTDPNASRPRGAKAGEGEHPGKADWYPDPTRRFELRYWDGDAWTPHVSRAQVTSEDAYDAG